MWSSEQPYGLRTITYFTEKGTDIEEVKQFPKVTQRTSSIWGRHVLKALWETNTIHRPQACLPQASSSLFPHRYRHLFPSPVVAAVQSLSPVWLFETPWTAARQASLSHSLLEFTQTHVRWIDDAIQPSHPLSPLSSPALNLPQH